MKKRIFSLFLALCMIVGLLPTVAMPHAHAEAEVAAQQVSAKPFYGLSWSPVEMALFGNLSQAPTMTVSLNGDVVTISGYADPAAKAADMKAKLDARPEGMRYIRFVSTGNALKVADHVIYADKGVEQLKAHFTAFIEAFAAIGGKLDGIILDTEYVDMGAYYIYTKAYGGHYEPTAEEIAAKGYNRNIYNDIVAHPQYATEIRPLLERRGFKFYEEIGGNKSEIWSMYYPSLLSKAEQVKYDNCYEIWTRVMYDRIAAYFNDAIYEPMAALYPNATLSDYGVTDTATWLNHMSNKGGYSSMVGNATKTGNVSNDEMYNREPSNEFYFDGDGNYRYRNVESYNKAVFEADSYNALLFNVNKYKNMYAATDTKMISTWIGAYDYQDRADTVKNTPYYTEFMYHVGLLDPQPFLIYIYHLSDKYDKFQTEQGKIEYNKRMEVISQVLNELTRVAGYSDRKPIETPADWNNGFILSGMYANGRNIWRLTPDTTAGMTLDAFRVAGEEPTFCINGTTITFPEGNIIKDSSINVVGTCGYWIETAKDVQPVITREADHFVKYPAYQESFDYADGTAFNGTNAKDVQGWEASADLLVEDGALALTGTATLSNVKIPKNVTAGDSYAKKQIWEVSVTLPTKMSTSTSQYVTLLSAGTNDGFKIAANAVYYGKSGSYTKISGLTLSAGQKYTLRREMDFGTNTCTYSVLNANGSLVKQVKDVSISSVTTPVSAISMSSTSMSTKVLVDDYKLYPTGIAYELELYNAVTGVQLTDIQVNQSVDVAYRLSWMNAGSATETINVRVAQYDNTGALVADAAIDSVTMKPGYDGVKTGIVENTTGKVKIYLQICTHTAIQIRGKVDATCANAGYTGDRVCKDCGNVMEHGTVIPAHPNQETIYGKEATCAEPGLTEGMKCAVCGLVTVEQVEIPATGHTEETIDGKKATCTESGLSEGTKCAVCKETIKAQTEIPANGHTASEAVKENEVASTLTTRGSYDLVVYCATCGAEASRESVTMPLAGVTVTLWGIDVTIDNDDTTEDIPAARYWKNGATAEDIPVDSDASNWNYSFTIDDGVPTVTLKAAKYNYGSRIGALLSATLEGSDKLVLKYEDKNDIDLASGTVVAKRRTYRLVRIITESTDASFDIIGAKDAELDISINYSTYVIDVPYATLNIKGGTLNYTRTGAHQGFIDSTKGKLNIEDCTIKCTSTTASSAYPVIAGANLTTINNATIDIDTLGGAIVGGYQKGAYDSYANVDYPRDIIIKGKSQVKITVRETGKKAYSGIGIFARSLSIEGGEIEISAAKAALGAGTVTVDKDLVPDLNKYDGDCAMYTAKDGVAVNDYTTTTYFKVVRDCKHAETTTEEVVEEATCNKAGAKTITVTCDECGKCISETTEEIAVLPHTEVTDEAAAADCENSGLTEGKHCSVCGEVLIAQQVIPAKGHGYKEVVTAPDCVSGGYTTYTCACGDTYVGDYTEALGHTPKAAVKENEVVNSCTKPGSYEEVVYCAVCDAELSRTPVAVDPAGHTPGEAKQENYTDSTCSAEGGYDMVVRCSECTAVISSQAEVVAKKTHTEEIIPAVAATCSGNGKTEGKKCSVCGEILKAQEEIPATGHVNTTEKVTTIDATCTTAGSKTTKVTCACGYVVSEIVEKIPATGHTYADDADKECNICNAVRATITKAYNKVTVNANDTTVRRVYVFNITGKTVDDINNWGQLQAADSNYWGTKKTEFALEDGTYVLRVEYYDANDVICADSYQIDINYEPKELQITTNENIVTVNVNNITFRRVYVFNITGKTVDDINNWGQLQAADSNYWGTKKTEFALEDGTYVLRVEYYDANDVICADSYQIDINYDPKELQITANKNTVTVNINNITFRRVYVFNITGKTVGDINNWGQLQAADANYWSTKKTEFALENGTYVLRVEYYDANDVICADSYQIEINYESKEPQIIVNENTVTVNNNGTTFRRVYVFNITGKTVGDINNWSQLQAADTNYWSTKKTEFILEEGTYVLCIEYYDVANNYCTYFEQVPIS